MAYATRADVYDLGLPAQAFVSRPRKIESVDAATGTITLPGHGLAANGVLRLEVIGGSTTPGTTASALPTGWSASTTYYAIPVGSDMLRIAATSGGSVVIPSTAGTGVFGVIIDPGSKLDANLEASAAIIDEHLTAYKPPIDVDPITGAYPEILVVLNARMAARDTITVLGLSNPQYKEATDRIFAFGDFDAKLLADWKAGKPLAARPVDQSTSTTENGARAASRTSTRNWEGTGGYIL